MSRIVCFSIPLYGHVNYCLKLAAKLTELGHEVLFYSGTSFKEFIVSKGVTFASYSSPIESLFQNSNTAYSAEYMQYAEPLNADYIEEIYKYAFHLHEIQDFFMRYDIEYLNDFKPELVIYDTAAIWGKYVARYLNIPCVCSCTPYNYPDAFIRADPALFTRLVLHQKISWELADRMIHGMNIMLGSRFPLLENCDIRANWCGSGDLNLIYSVRSFQLGEMYLSHNANLFCGILLEDGEADQDVQDLLTASQKNVYISFGSIYNNAALLRSVAERLVGLEHHFILNIGPLADAGLYENLPDNWKVIHHVSQVSLLKHVDAFVSHGGVNSVREAAHFGVPMVLLPSEGDTLCTAEDVVRGNYGISISPDDLAGLEKALCQILGDLKIRENCNRLSNEMQAAGGIKRAVSSIEELIKWRETR